MIPDPVTIREVLDDLPAIGLRVSDSRGRLRDERTGLCPLVAIATAYGWTCEWAEDDRLPDPEDINGEWESAAAFLNLDERDAQCLVQAADDPHTCATRRLLVKAWTPARGGGRRPRKP